MDRLGVMEVFVLAVETGSFSAVATHGFQIDCPA